MQIKGYNGFPSLPLYTMQNTGLRGRDQNGELDHSNDYFCANSIDGANIEQWADSHRNLLGQINPNDRRTWVKAWSGIYLSDFYELNDGTRYRFDFTFPSCSGVTTYEQATNWTVQDQTIAIECIRNYYVVGVRVWGLFYGIMFDMYYNTYNQGGPLTEQRCGRFYKFSGGINNFQTESSLYLQGFIYPYGSSTPTKPPLIPSQVLTESYYLLTGYLCTDFGGSVYNEKQSGDTSKSGGGDGNYGDEDTDEIPDDGTPTISAISSGFVSLYNPTPAQLLGLRNFLYNADASIIDKWMRLTDNAFNYLIGLKLFPCQPVRGASSAISLGGVESEITAYKVGNQYKTIDCGSVNVQECYGGFLDYTNTSVKIYLPFCGEMELDTPIVMHGTVNLKYKVDFLTGDCMACVTVTDNHGVRNSEVYFSDGNCACDIPLTGRNDITSLTSILGAGMSMITGGVSGAIGAITNPEQFNPKVQRVGNISGAVGMLGQYTPYIIIQRPAQSFPSNNNMLLGRPSNIGGRVDRFSGYTEIEYIKLDGIQATDSELEEIRTLLENGVYI